MVKLPAAMTWMEMNGIERTWEKGFSLLKLHPEKPVCFLGVDDLIYLCNNNPHLTECYGCTFWDERKSVVNTSVECRFWWIHRITWFCAILETIDTLSLLSTQYLQYMETNSCSWILALHLYELQENVKGLFTCLSCKPMKLPCNQIQVHQVLLSSPVWRRIKHYVTVKISVKIEQQNQDWDLGHDSYEVQEHWSNLCNSYL